MSLGRVSFIKKEKNGVVFVSGLYQAQVGDGDSLHSFAFRASDKYGGGMHSWAVAGSDAGGSITKILEDVYNTGKINPCITASKITVDKVKYTVSFYFEIQDSPDGKAYTGFSSWGGAGGSTSAPSGHAYDNYKKEYDAVVKNNPTVTIAIINDFWYPAFFRQVFFQYTRKKFPNLQKGANSKKGTVGVSINQNLPPKNNDVKVLAYNPTGVQPITEPGLSTVVFSETAEETQSEATSNEAVAEVNAVAAPPVEPPVPRVPDFSPDKIFTFNVEKSQKNSPISGFWFSPEAGTFSIVPFEPEFQFTGDEDEQLLDDEYYELGFEGSEEDNYKISAIQFPNEEDTSNGERVENTNNVDTLSGLRSDGFNPAQFWTESEKGNKGYKLGAKKKGAETVPLNPDLICGTTNAIKCYTLYPKTNKWGGDADPIIKIKNPPLFVVDLDLKKVIPSTVTLVTIEVYIYNAKLMILKLIPGATKAQKTAILISAFSISRQEQGGPNGGFKGFNNNISGIEASGFSVFKDSDVIGKVIKPEGGTGTEKKYYAFASLSSGLVPLITKIIDRNMWATGGSSNEWAWRYYRDWNGFGGRTTKTYATHMDDCKIITNIESVYNTSAKVIKDGDYGF